MTSLLFAVSPLMTLSASPSFTMSVGESTAAAFGVQSLDGFDAARFGAARPFGRAAEQNTALEARAVVAILTRGCVDRARVDMRAAREARRGTTSSGHVFSARTSFQPITAV